MTRSWNRCCAQNAGPDQFLPECYATGHSPLIVVSPSDRAPKFEIKGLKETIYTGSVNSVTSVVDQTDITHLKSSQALRCWEKTQKDEHESHGEDKGKDEKSRGDRGNDNN